MRNAVGLLLLGGKRTNHLNFNYDALNHQTEYQYGVGYNYIWYNDTKSSAQNSGGFALHINNFSIYHENDVFGGQARDRFRTGQFQLAYRTQDIQFGMGIQLWTGETRNAKWHKVKSESHPYGFKLLEDKLYGKTSHGILYASLDIKLPYAQTTSLRIGIDSEHVRHVVQNRLFHDLPFMPKTFERNTPHYPMIGEDGCPVFDKKDAKPTSLFMQFGLNNNWSY